MIREHMSVYGSDGRVVGVVDRLEDDRIKLTRNDSLDGEHHFIAGELVDHVDDHVHLNRSAEDLLYEWEGDELDLDVDDEETEIEQSDEQKQTEWIERRR